MFHDSFLISMEKGEYNMSHKAAYILHKGQTHRGFYNPHVGICHVVGVGLKASRLWKNVKCKDCLIIRKRKKRKRK